MSRHHEFLQGLRDMLPMLLGAMPFGIIYGSLAGAAGLTPWQTIGMSLLVFAGSAQFIAISLLGGGATLAVLARADAIVAVGTGDPVGAARLQAGLGELALLAPSAPITVLLNRVGEGGRRTRAARQLAARLRAAVPCLDVRLLPDDPGEEGPLRRALGAWIHGPAVTGDLGSRDPRP